MYVCMYVCIYIYIYALFIKLLVSKRNNYIYYSKQLLQIIRINKFSRRCIYKVTVGNDVPSCYRRQRVWVGRQLIS